MTQVNEMLARMETHDLPFVCTTNLFERLDEASLRRFTFKVELRHLTSEQAATAFRLFFGMEPPKSLSRLSVLTPGDFATVARQARLFGTGSASEQLVTMLADECRPKRRRAKTIGFQTAGFEPTSFPRLS